MCKNYSIEWSELLPNDHHKSFYGKAMVRSDCLGYHLYSYGTHVCSLMYIDTNGNDLDTPVFVRTWGGYSATTMRHINAFLAYYGIPGGGKAWWDGLEVG